MQNTHKPLVALALVAFGVPAQILACGGSEKPANTAPPSQTVSVPPGSGSAWGTPSGTPTGPSSWGPTASASAPPSAWPSATPSAWPSGVPSGFPTALPSGFPTALPSGFPTAFPTASGSASSGAATTVADAAADVGLLALAPRVAAGMQPEGARARFDLQEGGHSDQIITLQPGRCYTIVGFSPPGQIKDLDLHLLAPPLYSLSAGDDKTTDNAPVIGKTPSPICPISPIALPYKLDVSAKKGAGKAAVQVYSKAK